MKTAQEIRQTFLDYFEGKGHKVVPSAPVVPHNDPTLLFINAGMNQFKDVFLGTGTRDYKRACDTQKCVRVSGKHNDLEEVGVDTYHHTYFEMLGNWSFGDYFKRESITWAWDLLVNVYKLDPSRLYVTVFGGDEEDGLGADTEAEALWAEVTDINPDHILRFGKKDNFWEMGDTGPCGPCTEIHYDRGPGAGEIPDSENPGAAVNGDYARVIEVWNLVFIQYNRNKDGSLEDLPEKHVDTGMGFERLVAVLQEKNSNYETDLFAPIFAAIEKHTGVQHKSTESVEDIACRVIADHIRTLCVAFADGALPGNEGRGYVLRRILRRASRFGRQNLNQSKPFIYRLVASVAEALGDIFPEIKERQSHIELLIESEEKAFAKTLDRGLALYGELSAKVKSAGAKEIAGEEAFDLYATFGFPRDLVELMAREDDLTVASAGWDKAQEEHRQASKAAGNFGHRFDLKLLEGQTATKQSFYRAGHCGEGNGVSLETTPVKLIDESFLILEQSPFYSESGGQVGDCGRIKGDDFLFQVTGVYLEGALVIHQGQLLQGNPHTLPGRVMAEVDIERRGAIMRNHTATHLLHWALKKVLGDHATQQGSLVSHDKLRFDLTHPQGISNGELLKIEALVNGKIVENTKLVTSLENLEAAKERGVTALFGEKYDDDVRVVDIGGYSTELCGGTHVDATGDIGPFLILSESSVQAGVRRIEAVTGFVAVEQMQKERELLRLSSAAMKTKAEDLPGRIEALQLQVKELRKSGGQKSAADAGTLAKSLLGKAEEFAGGKMIVAQLDCGAKDLAAVADVLRNNHGALAGLLLGVADGKVPLVAFAAKDLAGSKVHAGKLAKEIAGILGGGGGGRPDFAQAGGKNPGEVEKALEAARAHLTAALS